MRKKLMWGLAVVVLVATPAIIGLVLVGGNDHARSKGALVPEGGAGGGYELVVSGLTPAGQAAELLSYSWGVTSNATFATGSMTAGKAQFSDLQVTKKIDTASPLFVKGAAQGTHYPSAKLTIYKPGTKAGDYAIYQMTDVIVTGVNHGGTAAEVPTEQVTLAYAKLQVTLKDVDESGAVTKQTTFTYDLATGK